MMVEMIGLVMSISALMKSSKEQPSVLQAKGSLRKLNLNSVVYSDVFYFNAVLS